MASNRFTGLFLLLLLILYKLYPVISINPLNSLNPVNTHTRDYLNFQVYLTHLWRLHPRVVVRHVNAAPLDPDGQLHRRHIADLMDGINNPQQPTTNQQKRLNFAVANLLAKKDFDTRRRQARIALLRAQRNGAPTQDILAQIGRINREEQYIYDTLGFTQELARLEAANQRRGQPPPQVRRRSSVQKRNAQAL